MVRDRAPRGVWRAGVLAVAACCAAAAPSLQAAAATHGRRSGAAARFLADSAPVERLSARFEVQALAWASGSPVTNARASADAKPLIVALARLRGDLLHQPWPAHARHDAAALAASCGALVTDLQALGRVHLAVTSSWEPALLRDDGRATSAGDRLRHDLGLPPAS